MPVYEYRCRSCAHEFEIQQSMTDDALSVCPECGGELRKVFSPVGIAFKGSGFYKTDSGSRSTSAGSSDSGSSGSGSSGSGSSGSGSGSGSGSKDQGSGGASSGSGDSGSKATAGSTSSSD